jgi:hypothetical protein
MMKSARARPYNGSAFTASFFARLRARGETFLPSFFAVQYQVGFE